MGIRILVVDDATFIRDMIKKQLRDKIPGVEVFDAPDGARALAQLKGQAVDLILSDWEMPNMTGAELLTAVRAMPHDGTIPFVMISSRGDRNHIVKAIELGVSDYLTKPFSAEELLKKVFKQLKLAGKSPTQAVRTASTQGIAFASVDVLTGSGGGTPKAVAPKPINPFANNSAGALGAKPAAPSAPVIKAVETPKAAKGKAQLRFSNNRTFACVIREMSLQLMSCLMQRTDDLPTVFEQAVVDIETGDGSNLARVNGYVHSIQAGENRPDTSVVKIVIRFVDNDAEKFETLSKYIAQM
ncbi:MULTISPECIES: response regulator [Cellvibrio]|uniref:CheY-like chemotaxis protein n=1 Tax=Cellvibrio fibrivorans TaxID=126350 RepID=A0ABU1V1K9_9GAMM|nr:response regulator [Cellvibrio fibrivorans]MDR7091198.1 CheY-like chemotaxis protein [Cellvibrio fibrivorans]